jgi:hypothetical protein
MTLPDIVAYLPGALVILGYISLLLFKENLFSRWAEYSVVALAVGWSAVFYTYDAIGRAWEPLVAGNWTMIIPIILGLLMYLQFSRSYRWVIRWPLAVVSSTALMLNATARPVANFVMQIQALAIPLTTGAGMDVFNGIVALIGALTVMSYFTFTREHTGPLAISAKVGRYFMMLTFGGAFSMAYISQGTFIIGALNYLFSTCGLNTQLLL